MSSIKRDRPDGAAPKPVRILHVVETMLGMGGMEKGLINMTRTLPAERFEHVVCVLRSLGPLADTLPSEVRLVHAAGKQSRSQAKMLLQLIREVKPDIVHSRNWGAIEAVFAARWAGAAAVHSEHGLEILTARSEPWRRRVVRRVAFELTDAVFCVSNDLRNLHRQRTGFPAGRIGVIHNGVDTSRFRPDRSIRDAARQHFGITASDFCIGAAGRLEPVKDVFTLLRATARFSAVTDRWRLLIAGDGSQLKTLRAYVAERPELAGHVRFLGDLDDMPFFLNALDVYVLSSVFEGICNSLLEAMATGVSPVVTAVGGNVEVVEEGKSGLLFSPEDDGTLSEHLQMLFRDASFRSRVATGALQRAVQAFSLSSMTEQYERLYETTALRRCPNRVARFGREICRERQFRNTPG